jgi:diguanylate cyclase (GGDEF)-like protein
MKAQEQLMTDCHTPPSNMVTNQADVLRTCVEVGKLLTSTLNLKEILELIMIKVSRLIRAQHWSLLLKNEVSGELTFEIVVGSDKALFDGISLKPDEGVASFVAETGKAMFIPDVNDSPMFNKNIDLKTGFTTRSIICLPLLIGGKSIGVIEVINVEDMKIFEQEDFPILTILADYAAIAINNSRYVDRIKKMSIMDEYTGLYNARYLHQILDNHCNGADQKSPLAVVFVDIDNFKSIVDAHGHLLGTRLLKEVGETISNNISEQDILIKYGGDEYIILLPGRGKHEAVKRSENILRAIRESTYLMSEANPARISASFGIASYPEDATTKKELLISADNALFTIKHLTKNGIGVA